MPTAQEAWAAQCRQRRRGFGAALDKKAVVVGQADEVQHLHAAMSNECRPYDNTSCASDRHASRREKVSKNAVRLPELELELFVI